MRLGAWLVPIALASNAAIAQWPSRVSPGMPRTAAGELLVSAPAPRFADGTPDLSGVWRIDAGRGYNTNILADLKPAEIEPWAENLFRSRASDFVKDDPSLRCLPSGPRRLFKANFAKFVQTPSVLVILYEDLSYRQIHLDGRPLPASPHPTCMGYSVGRWEGDTLVIASSGFNPTSWLDDGGHPLTEGLGITERLTRRDLGHIDVELTFEGRAAYARPWTVPLVAELIPDAELIESECNEVDPDEYRLSGRTVEQESLSLSAEVLRRYVGDFVRPATSGAQAIRYTVRLEGTELRLDVDAVGNLPLIAISATSFSPPIGGV